LPRGAALRTNHQKGISLNMVVELTDATFQTEVLKSDLPYLVDFWATWCGPCRIIAPIVDDLANEYEGRLKVGKVNTDENQAVAAEYGISAIPALLLFKGGQLQERIVGAVPKNVLKQVIDKHLS
jgi:thioredoxin 1